MPIISVEKGPFVVWHFVYFHDRVEVFYRMRRDIAEEELVMSGVVAVGTGNGDAIGGFIGET